MNATATSTLQQRFFLTRLDLMVTRRVDEAAGVRYYRPGDPLSSPDAATASLRRRLLDRAIYSAYLDCVDSGIQEEAERLLEKLREELVRQQERQAADPEVPADPEEEESYYGFGWPRP